MIDVIKRPIVTEKTTIQNAGGVYAFEVDLRSEKPEIKKAIEQHFRVRVASVKTMVCRGHRKQTKFGMTKAPYWKKALVQLAPGEKISLFEGA